MATLTRVKSGTTDEVAPSLALSVPTPFPIESLHVDTLALNAPVEQEKQQQDPRAGPSHVVEPSEFNGQESLHELMPSIVHVERACLMALNNLLSVPVRWKTIVPDRRHSMPSSPQSTSVPHAEIESSSSALQTLVSNLRNREGDQLMVEAPPVENDSDLIHELRTRVEDLSSSLDPSDALLVRTLISLLSHLNRLSIIVNPSPSPGRMVHVHSWNPAQSSESSNFFDTLTRQLSDFQIERLSSQQDVAFFGSTPVLAVEATLLWTRIDEELESVVSMCRERTEMYLPPQYDPADYELDTLPAYDHASRPSLEDQKSRSHAPQSPVVAGGQLSEKMKLDLEAVTMAIDRLYLVAPQLHNQRVELKSSKLAQMERARREGGSQVSSSRSTEKRKEEERNIQELENMFDLINKASARTLKDQSFILVDGMKSRMEKARLRDIAKKEAFVEQLAEHSSAGRLHDQDALHQRRKEKDPEALLSLPEFIREAVPTGSQRTSDPQALLSLPEFVKEAPPPHLMPSTNNGSRNRPPSPAGPLSRLRAKSRRERSNSAPPLAWLRSSPSKSNLRDSQVKTSETAPGAKQSSSRLSFEVNYVAENHENLQHILIFFTVTGAQSGIDLEAEVLPSFSNSQADDGDRLIVKSGPNVSLPLILPGRVSPGKQDIKVQSGHFEVKLTTLSTTASPSLEHLPLLDATQLTSIKPTSFICASCSLPLIQSMKVHQYRDLPSEHWEELVDAWMCHSAQKLNEQVAKHGRGFWPEPGQALVGGSYILFEEQAITKDNLHPPEVPKEGDDRRVVRCLCGAIIGRCQEHQSGPYNKAAAYRILKYAVRPVSPSAEPQRIPLSAFIVEDMIEFVQAHASYRFVVSDEENERPRILLWLFKPHLQIAYSIPKQYAIPKSGSICAAKVLYKLIGPAEGNVELKSILEKYPGFPQAEHLLYPMSTCQRLAGLLKESNRTYPENLRTMTGLEVGWLQRA